MQSNSQNDLTTVCNLIDTSVEENVIIINEDVSDNSAKQVWLDGPTKLMLSLLTELQPQVGKTAYLKNKQKLWKVVADNLKLNGYIFTPLQVQTKFRSLERQFKKVKFNNSRTGRNPITCQYQSELENLLGGKKGINPDFILDNEALDGKSSAVYVEEDTVNTVNCLDSDLDFFGTPSTSKGNSQIQSAYSETPSTSNGNNKRQSDISKKFFTTKKRSTQDKALDVLKNMAEDKKNYQDNVLKLLNDKDERSKSHESRSKRKLELLELIASKFLKE